MNEGNHARVSAEWSSPTEASGNKSSTLLGELIALRPVSAEEDTMETVKGLRPVRWVEALIINPEDGSVRNLGELPIFWQVIRRQLSDARPWLVGRITQSGKAFRMAPPAKEEGSAINHALRSHIENPQPVEVPEDLDTGAEDFPEEAPY